ncbi:MAG: hypothetical protein P4L03_03760 [Terracidiphilus sp.]|nr:hypothetical protein [Terracidiphilus sp.]
MVIFHVFLALLAGFLTIVALTALLTALVRWLVPGWATEDGKPAAGYAFFNIAGSFVSAAAGGCVATAVAAANPMHHVLTLGVIVLALAALSALQQRGKQPVWYLLTLVAAPPMGVLAGGLLWLRMAGILG